MILIQNKFGTLHMKFIRLDCSSFFWTLQVHLHGNDDLLITQFKLCIFCYQFNDTRVTKPDVTPHGISKYYIKLLKWKCGVSTDQRLIIHKHQYPKWINQAEKTTTVLLLISSYIQQINKGTHFNKSSSQFSFSLLSLLLPYQVLSCKIFVFIDTEERKSPVLQFMQLSSSK